MNIMTILMIWHGMAFIAAVTFGRMVAYGEKP